MLLKVLYFFLGISFHASQADNGLPPSNKFFCQTANCLSDKSEPPAQKEDDNPAFQIGNPMLDYDYSSLLQTTSNSEPAEQAQTLDYRWENYDGTPPEDALSFNYSYYGTPPYIGRVKIPNVGTCMGLLLANVVQIEVNCNGYYKETENIEILCVGHKEDYKWETIDEDTNKKEFLDTVKDNELVKGGYNETTKVDTFVSRYDKPPMLISNFDKNEGEVCYGYRDQWAECRGHIFEVLMYKPAKEETPREKPGCSDIQLKGVDASPQVRVANVPTPSEINPGAASPNQPNVEFPSQPKISLFQTTCNSEPAETLDYRWENYDGTPPEDALSFNYSYYGTPPYIGRVKIPNVGTCMGLLLANVVQIEVNCNGYYKETENIEILCVGHKEDYKWETIDEDTNKKEFLDTVKDNELVKGGYNETTKVDTFVSRYDKPPMLISNFDKNEGEVCYGYRDQWAECRGHIFEVLMYKPAKEETPREKPGCSDIQLKGVDASPQVRVAEVPTPSEINLSAASPNQPNVELPSQPKIESNPTEKISVG